MVSSEVRSSSTATQWLAASGAIVGLLVVLAVLGAHFLRRGQLGAAVAIIASPAALLVGRAWGARLLSLALLAGALVWLQTAVLFVRIRLSIGHPWGRLALILGTVTLLTALAPLLLRVGALKRLLAARSGQPLWAPTIAALLTALLLGIVQLKVPRPMLLTERFLPGFGWLQILAAALYAGWAAEKLLSPDSARWRRRIWTLFSIVFFAQLALGLLVDVRFLMRPGVLHLPIPALILGGPLFRGEHFFMLALFLSTLVLVGPAWCSHICYLGAWDNLSAQAGPKRPRALPRWSLPLRVALLLALVAAAYGLGRLGASPLVAGGLALAFGLGGVALMLLVSRRRGTMVHCALYCPLGLAANVLGKVSPFRLRIGEGCTACGRCTVACRYDALGPERLAAKRVGLSCTLCGDCLPTCRSGDIRMWLPGASPTLARAIFVALVVALHAASLCLARV
jgi:ferredoxin